MTYYDDTPTPTDKKRAARIYKLSRNIRTTLRETVRGMESPDELLSYDADDQPTEDTYHTPDPHGVNNTPSGDTNFDADALNQCHRRAYYTTHNAPPEPTTPDGTFHRNRRLEDTLITPILQQHTEEDTTTRSSLITHTHVNAGIGEPPLRVTSDNGPTVVVDNEDPLLTTLTFTTPVPSLINSPRPRHHAQLMASLVAHRRRWNRSIRGLLIYITPPENDDDTPRVNTHELDWNPMIWYEDIVPWITAHHEFRTNEAKSLPDKLPTEERDQHCRRCPFQERCGMTDTPVEDMNATGFAPDIDYDADVLDSHTR